MTPTTTSTPLRLFSTPLPRIPKYRDLRHSSISSSQPSLQYSNDSGQVYVETTCSSNPNDAQLDDVRVRRFPRTNTSGEAGAASLEQMAMREIMRNITSLTARYMGRHTMAYWQKNLDGSREDVRRLYPL